MGKYDFDVIHDRRNSNCNKWAKCDSNVIPMTIADMEFPVPDVIMNALRKRLEHPFLGYENIANVSLPMLKDFYSRRFGCTIEADWPVYVLAVMPGIYHACKLVGGGVMYCTPIYKHIRRIKRMTGLPVVEVPMKNEDGIYYMDIDAMEEAITPEVKSFVLCNPHNPVGRAFTKEELDMIVDFCKRHNLVLISDEIHSEFSFDHKHIPAFEACKGTGVKSITLSSPGKTCNIPKCQLAFAIIPDDDLRESFTSGMYGVFAMGNILDGVAFRAAYSEECDDWKDSMLAYVKANRDYIDERFKKIPLIDVCHNEGTFLLWMDCSKMKVENPAVYIQEHAGVKLDPGDNFGEAYGQYVRMNFACPMPMLKKAIDRIENAVKELM